jgi:hypothetical protein
VFFALASGFTAQTAVAPRPTATPPSHSSSAVMSSVFEEVRRLTQVASTNCKLQLLPHIAASMFPNPDR